MQYLQLGKSLARLVDLTVLRQAGAVNAITCSECRTPLQSFAAIFDRFGKASGEIMGDSETCSENRILRVVRAQPDRLLQMRDRPCGLSRIASFRCVIACSDWPSNARVRPR